MTHIVNLRSARKKLAKEAARAAASMRSAKFGRTKAEREAEAAEKARAATRLDGHERGD